MLREAGYRTRRDPKELVVNDAEEARAFVARCSGVTIFELVAR